MAYIRKYRESWRAEVQRHGQRVTKVLPTKREAQAWALKAEAQLDEWAGGGRHTFGELADLYLDRVTPAKRSARWEVHSVERLRQQIGHDTQLSTLTAQALGLWRDKRLETVSGSTVLREANLLRAMLKTARDEWEWQIPDGFKALRLPRHNPPRAAIWTWQDVRRVLRAPRTGKTAEMQAAFRIALHTGLRLKEVLSAEWDAAGHTLVLRDTKTDLLARVPVPRRAVKLFPVAFTVQPNEGSTLFSRLTRDCGVTGLTFHDARASALTWLSRRVDVMTLARISRHRDIGLLVVVYYRETAEQIAARI